MRTIEQVIERFGGITALAKALGCTTQAISMWKANEEIPTSRHFQLEVLTDGWFRAPRSDNTSTQKRA